MSVILEFDAQTDNGTSVQLDERTPTDVERWMVGGGIVIWIAELQSLEVPWMLHTFYLSECNHVNVVPPTMHVLPFWVSFWLTGCFPNGMAP